MKKIILGLMLAVAALSFADAKSDYESVQQLVKENKTEEGIKILENLTKSTDAVYATKANYQLGMYYASKNDLTKAKTYFTSASKNPADTSFEALDSLSALAEISFSSKNNLETEKNLLELNRRTKNQNLRGLIDLIVFYNESNQVAKATSKYDEIKKSLSTDQVAAVDNELGSYYIGKNNLDKAKEYFNKSLSSGTGDVAASAALRLAEIANQTGVDADTEKNLKIMNDKLEWKNPVALKILGTYYLNKKDYVKSEETYKKSEVLFPKEVEPKVLLLELYETKKDIASVTKKYSEIKALKPESLNKNLGLHFAQVGNGELAEKYLRKSITEDKDNTAKVILGIYLYNVNRASEATTLLNEASKSGVKEADQVLNSIKEAEANKSKNNK